MQLQGDPNPSKLPLCAFKFHRLPCLSWDQIIPLSLCQEEGSVLGPRPTQRAEHPSHLQGYPRPLASLNIFIACPLPTFSSYLSFSEHLDAIGPEEFLGSQGQLFRLCIQGLRNMVMSEGQRVRWWLFYLYLLIFLRQGLCL